MHKYSSFTLTRVYTFTMGPFPNKRHYAWELLLILYLRNGAAGEDGPGKTHFHSVTFLPIPSLPSLDQTLWICLDIAKQTN